MYIYLFLEGRIGNQLFQYAFARAIQKQIGGDTKIIIDETAVIKMGWINSLKEYELPNVEYVRDSNCLKYGKFFVPYVTYRLYNRLIRRRNTRKQFALEKKLQPILNYLGLVAVERGYCSYKVNVKRNLILSGYFQSERFFANYSQEIREQFNLQERLLTVGYPFVEQLKERNSVCISIKVEDNAGNYAYDVCHEDYYQKALAYISEKVDNPLFFLCSDNVEHAKKLYLNDEKYDVICQPKEFSVHLSLAAMSLCKHFIINNTTFGWWAQYLSENEEKIVVAPSKWKNTSDPVSIYDNQKNWHLIEC